MYANCGGKPDNMTTIIIKIFPYPHFLFQGLAATVLINLFVLLYSIIFHFTVDLTVFDEISYSYFEYNAQIVYARICRASQKHLCPNFATTIGKLFSGPCCIFMLYVLLFKKLQQQLFPFQLIVKNYTALYTLSQKIRNSLKPGCTELDRLRVLDSILKMRRLTSKINNNFSTQITLFLTISLLESIQLYSTYLMGGDTYDISDYLGTFNTLIFLASLALPAMMNIEARVLMTYLNLEIHTYV